MHIENRFFYRIINVMYYFGLLVLAVTISCTLYISFSQSTPPDIRKSYITCFNNKKFFLDNFHDGLKLYSNRLYFDNMCAQKICTMCGTSKEKNPMRNAKPSHGQLFANISKTSNYNIIEASNHHEIAKYEELVDGKDYFGYYPANVDPLSIISFSANIKYKSLGWNTYYETTMWCTLISLICYAGLNLLKEVLLYIAFGRYITWDWLLKYLR